MTALSPSAVAAGLGLPDGLSPWLEELERVGPPAGGVPLPRGEDAARLLGRLRVAGPDAAAIAGALPDPDGSPELWWLLERSYQQLRSVIGDPDAMVWPPSLPSALDAAGRCFWVFVLMALAGDVRRWHGEQGIPDEVSWSTLADLGRHVARYRRRHGVTGLDSQGWLGLHSRGGLYELGRLQFNPYRLRTGMAGPLFWYEGGEAAARGPGFQPGDPVLGVHVPEGAPLAPERCDESFLAARSFFPRHLPARAGRVATCTSWLLDEQLAGHLPAASNILRFQRRFELVPGARDDDDGVFWFVFDRPVSALDELRPRTTLEHALVRHVREGGHWRLRTGWLEL